jgi:hypothetical protein
MRKEQAGLSCCVSFIPPQAPLANDWGELKGDGAIGFARRAEKS